MEEATNSEQDVSPLIRFFLFCITTWKKIQMEKIQILILQRKLHYVILAYVKRRQMKQRELESFYNPSMKKLLEYIRSPLQFYKIFRVGLPAFLNLKNILYQSDSKASFCVPEIELLVFLFWLSAGASYKKVSKLLNLSLSTVTDIVNNSLENCVKKMPKVICFPRENVSDIGENFQEISSCHIFGLVMGCLDIYHVKINTTSNIDKAQFLNSENELSVQVQVVCNHKGSAMSLAVGFPGNLTKYQVLQYTPLYLNNNVVPPDYILLSSSGYPCLQEPFCLLSPFKTCTNIAQTRFNSCLEEVHSTVMAKGVGQIFERWRRIFSKPINLPLLKITQLLIACTMIQNICLEVNDEWPKEAPVNFSLNEVLLNAADSQLKGEETRKQIALLMLRDDEIEDNEYLTGCEES